MQAQTWSLSGGALPSQVSEGPERLTVPPPPPESSSQGLRVRENADVVGAAEDVPLLHLHHLSFLVLVRSPQVVIILKKT